MSGSVILKKCEARIASSCWYRAIDRLYLLEGERLFLMREGGGSSKIKDALPPLHQPLFRSHPIFRLFAPFPPTTDSLSAFLIDPVAFSHLAVIVILYLVGIITIYLGLIVAAGVLLYYHHHHHEHEQELHPAQCFEQQQECCQS
jgi:hypothetical protein